VLIHALPAYRERRAIGSLPDPPAGAPNVLLVILDTVRALSLSVHGYSRPTSPELAKVANQGVRFLHAQSPAPWTLPSHASLFTGREAHQLPTDWYVPLDDRDLTLAEGLAASGYLTAGFVANLPYTNREVGLARGFQRYEDWPLSLGQLAISSSLVRAITSNDRLRRLLGNHELVVRKRAPDINQAFLAWLDRRQGAGRPFFAFLNYYDAHTPFVPPEPFRSRFAPAGAPFHPDLPRRTEDVAWDPELIQGARNAYDGAIAYLDHHVGRLLAELERRGVLDRTLVIITSDHGEEFAEHGLFSHGNSLYLPALHVPLVIRFPGRVPAGLTVPTPVSVRDLPATVVELLELPTPPAFPGRSLVRLWKGDSTPDLIFTEVRHAPKLPAWYPSTIGDLLGVQEGMLRLIRNGDGRLEVYDLAADPEERHDLSGDPALAPRIARLAELAERARPSRAASSSQ
jgi:arylsulfatase A-like enzyme